MASPWLKFYPTNWRADPALRMCSAGARGVWIDMICLMHEATPYGHLLVNGHCPTDAQVAVLTGTPPEQFSQLMRELEEAGVFSRTKDGVIYSRRMTRMAKKAATSRNNGRKGGNPKLCNQTENSPLDNLQDKPPDKTQKLEARSQIEKTEAKASPKKTETSKATSLPADWQPTPQLIAFAISEGLSESEANREADRFQDHWQAKRTVAAGRKSDWDATWRNWVTSPYGLAAKKRDRGMAGNQNAKGSGSINGLAGALVRRECG